MWRAGEDEMRISDSVANYILDLLNQENGTAEIQRNELASYLGCVPSQINYVLTSRFTPEQGYIVESRRGGGGYIRITRMRLSKSDMIMHIVNSVGDSLDAATARAMTANLAAKWHAGCLRRPADPGRLFRASLGRCAQGDSATPCGPPFTRTCFLPPEHKGGVVMMCQSCGKEDRNHPYQNHRQREAGGIPPLRRTAPSRRATAISSPTGAWISATCWGALWAARCPGSHVARCPTCGASFEEITQSGKIGCADCYQTFRSQLMPVIQRIHGTTRHKGKVPGGSALRITGGSTR